MLLFQIKGRMYLSVAIPACIWGLCNLFINFYYGNRVEKLLLNLTDTLVLMLVSASFIAYLGMLYYFLSSRRLRSIA